MPTKTVLVTGASGFVASYVIDAFLNAGWAVKGTVRSLAKANHLIERYPDHADKLTFVQVPDLVTGEGLEDAVKGCDAVAHTASPYTFNITDPIKDLIDPAVKGTLSVLKAAKDEGIKHVVITSSFAAVTSLPDGGPWRDYTYTADDWNPATLDDVHDLPPPAVYSLSKKLAEKAAHEFAAQHGLVLSSINPPMIYGPPLQKIASRDEVNTSSAAIYALINGDEGRDVPWNRLPLFAHVADVATAHVRALEADDDKVAGKRFLICGGSFTWEDATSYLASQRPALRSRLPTLPASPDQYKDAGKPIATLDTSLAKANLGFDSFIGWEETLLSTVDALVEIEKQFA
ncbi:uncharacterized protein RHOBADRAFT_50856 [Rhodotorula graminis WP1]|uniref:NAD-dependent epimerase/dehydratase domain-containing protein n=1 Tax=Rhodotorula graminis (strain WP1) TaxID=578459 RepID=A0A194SCC3_RHOGW|nr:uncharacterized protein RHOBADRAFT_50856 [Rhodotorula graminis WP1]KPV78383.1 hypothetical protein RHOBADRAFT_50856 [Rhodotorula graminis WP1]